MKLSWKWLFEIYGISPGSSEWKRVAEVRTLLPLAGLEIASVVSRGAGLEDIIVARVKKVSRHPQADRLNVCVVNNGKEDLQIVCGAANVREDLSVALAPVGATLPGGLNIKAAKIRGVESFGMLCSESELGLAEKSEGILELPSALVVGQKFLDAIEVRDEIWELDLTPDRADCLSTIGLARELRRYFGQNSSEWPQVRYPERDLLEQEKAADVPIVKVENQAQEACPLYTAQLFEGFQGAKEGKIGYSKLFHDRLQGLGIERFKSGMVDLANYVLFELGQPLHTFDADQIVGSKIIIRFAKAGEKITTLDGLERSLATEDLVIADIEKPLALAGVMGSMDSGVTESTKRVVVESAYFDPEIIRATARRHKIISDAAYRFERGVNPQGIFEAAGRLSLLFRTQLGAKRRGAFVVAKSDTFDKAFESKSINLDLRKLQKTLGFEITSSEVAESLLATEIQSQPKSSNVLTVEVPSFRCDLVREIDLVEEIARVYGFEKIPARYPIQSKSFEGISSGLFDRWHQLRYAALRGDAVEVVPYAFISEQEKNHFAANLDLQALENPISDDWKYLRPSILPGLVANLSKHGSLKQKQVHIFEVGIVFEKSDRKPGLKNMNLKTRESLHLGWGMMGLRENLSWFQDKSSEAKDVERDYFDSKGYWEAIHQKLSASDARWRSVEYIPLADYSGEIPTWIPTHALNPGRSALLRVPALAGIRGFVGELHPNMVKKVMNFPAGWKFPIAVGEMRIFDDLWDWVQPQGLIGKLGQAPRLRVGAVSNVPSAERDISFTVEKAVTHDKVVALIRKVAKELKEVSCVDIFDLPEGGRRSMTYRLLLQAEDKTLKDEEIQQNLGKILTELGKSFGAILRD